VAGVNGEGRLPLVLCYHAISDVEGWPAALPVTEGQFAAHVRLLAARGYVGLTFAECERRRQAGTLPPRTAVVTFDDGYLSNLKALPILAEVGFPATVFVLPPFVESGRLLSWPGVDQWTTSAYADEMRPLRWDDLERLRSAGWEVGAHTLTHPQLPTVDDGRLDEELGGSKAALERRLGVCETVAYPYGAVDPRVAAAAGRHGFLAGAALGGWHHVDEPLRRPRVGLYPPDHGRRARLKLSPLTLRLRRAPVPTLREGFRGLRRSRPARA
jgi:peptidoglycan/xylan/chitin deacetylase (PgdA/CDA1 family)